MVRTIAHKHTKSGSVVKFVAIKRAKVWPTSRTKDLKEFIIGVGPKKTFKRTLAMKNRTGKSVNQINSSLEGFRPVNQRDRNMGKQGKTSFNNMTCLRSIKPIC